MTICDVIQCVFIDVAHQLATRCEAETRAVRLELNDVMARYAQVQPVADGRGGAGRGGAGWTRYLCRNVSQALHLCSIFPAVFDPNTII